MSPPSWLYWPAAVTGGTDLIRFTVTTADSSGPTNEFNIDHTNLTGNSIWDGRGTTNSVSAVAIPNPDRVEMWVQSGSGDETTIVNLYSTWELVDETSSSVFSIASTSTSTDLVRWSFQTGVNVWTPGNTYRLVGY